MKILILGSAGQIGAHLSEYLVNKNYEVIEFDIVNDQTYNIRSGESKILAVRNGKSKVTLYNPDYNIAFTITPGIQYNVGVDFGVWGKTWRDEIWIPQLAISLPPGGVRFTCHANTRCSRTYEFNVARGSASSNGTNTSNPISNSSASSNTASQCNTGRYLGRFALQSQQTGKSIPGRHIDHHCLASHLKAGYPAYCR